MLGAGVAGASTPKCSGVPILIVTSEASYHAPYDHCTSKYLTQARCQQHISYVCRRSASAATDT